MSEDEHEAADKCLELYAIFDDDDGLLYETLSDTPIEAIKSMGHCDDLTDRYQRLFSCKLTVRCVRVVIMGVATIERLGDD